jgi:hypothetical protein
VGPEQLLDGVGEFGRARILRALKEPSAPFPAKLSSPLLVLGCRRLTVLGAEVPENVIFMLVSCADTAVTLRLSSSAAIAMYFIVPPILLEEIIVGACSPSADIGGNGRRKRPRFGTFFAIQASTDCARWRILC